MSSRRPRVAVWKFASCDGCQLTLLSCEDELLTLTTQLDIVYFREATSHAEPGPYDISLVEGSITTREDIHRIKQIRADSQILVTLGACATSGGIQALRNFADIDQFKAIVYAHPDYIDTLATSSAIADHVHVDHELRGCPISREQLLQALTALLAGTAPRLPSGPVCIECKQRGVECLLVTDNIACLGPVTHAGCDALCPAFGRGCFGCFGPADTANLPGLVDRLQDTDLSDTDIRLIFDTFNVSGFRELGSPDGRAGGPAAGAGNPGDVPTGSEAGST